jgi:hypothetical protein
VRVSVDAGPHPVPPRAALLSGRNGPECALIRRRGNGQPELRDRGRTPCRRAHPTERQQERGAPLIAATLLTDDEVVLTNVPFIRDVERLASILGDLGVTVTCPSPEPRSVLPCRVRGGFLLVETAPLPAQDSVGGHDHQGLPPSGSDPDQPDPEDAIGPAKPGSADRSLRRGELVAKGKVLRCEMAGRCTGPGGV